MSQSKDITSEKRWDKNLRNGLQQRKEKDQSSAVQIITDDTAENKAGKSKTAGNFQRKIRNLISQNVGRIFDRSIGKSVLNVVNLVSTDPGIYCWILG